jgi:hypothetical protein
MASTHPTVKEFEQTFVEPMRKWAVYVTQEDLGKLDLHVRQLQTRSELLSRQLFKASTPEALQQEWQRVLREVERLIPTILNQVEKLKRDAWVGKQQIGKNQKSLRGYRSSVAQKPLLLDSEG